MRAEAVSLPAGVVQAAAGFSVGCCVAVTKAPSDTCPGAVSLRPHATYTQELFLNTFSGSRAQYGIHPLANSTAGVEILRRDSLMAIFALAGLLGHQTAPQAAQLGPRAHLEGDKAA